MTITLRIQYKGEAARKLSTEGRNEGAQDPPPYLQDVTRALNLFSIPPPDHTRPIYKSGFILCNWNTTRDSKLCHNVERGARRAQSVACKSTLDGLFISYIHMFENSKPIFLSHKYTKPREHSPQGRDTAPYQPRRRSLSPVGNHLRHPFRSNAERSWPSVAGSSSTRPSLSLDTGYQSSSKDKFADPVRTQLVTPVSQSPAPSAGVGLSHETLKILSESRSLQALLKVSSPVVDRPIKQEEDTFSPNLQKSHRYVLPTKAAGDYSASKNTQTHNQPVSSVESPSLGQNSSSYPEKATSREADSHTNAPNGSYVPHNPSEQVSKSRPNHSQTHPSSPPLPKRYSRFDVPYSTPVLLDRRASLNAPPRPARSISLVNEQKRFEHAAGYKSTWAMGTPINKRPLSPESRQRRSASPPHKRRFSDYEQSITTKRLEPRTLSQIPTQPRLGIPSRRLSSPPSRLERPASPKHRAQDVSDGLEVVKTIATSNAVEKAFALPDGPNARRHQTLALNRELWDVRRQITALKAREMRMLDELKRIRAPELAQSAVIPKAQTPEEILKNMEAELVLLRERLQKESVRRKFVEESCESERRRRKHAEDMLDDARREYSTPLVVPAMMDAFKKIAQLTGDALTGSDE